MEAHGVWPTVLNFEIWVHYVGLKASPLAEEIERLIAAWPDPTLSTFEAHIADPAALEGVLQFRECRGSLLPRSGSGQPASLG